MVSLLEMPPVLAAVMSVVVRVRMTPARHPIPRMVSGRGRRGSVRRIPAHPVRPHGGRLERHGHPGVQRPDRPPPGHLLRRRVGEIQQRVVDRRAAENHAAVARPARAVTSGVAHARSAGDAAVVAVTRALGVTVVAAMMVMTMV